MLKSVVVAVLNASLTGHISPIRVELDPQVFSYEDEAGTVVPGQISQSPSDTSTLSPFIRNRIFLLLENKLREGALLKNLIVGTTIPSGEEICFTTPTIALEKKDTMIHKLGARALLGDLERGQSHAQADSKMTWNGTQDSVRAEGERLGCKCSLVSKWISFVLVGKQIAADGQCADPCLDIGEPAFEQADQDKLGLLRRRAGKANYL